MLVEVSFISSNELSKSGTDRDNALFIFAASNDQLLIPTKLTPFSFPSYSNLLCKAFKGLLFALSANPNSSNNIIDIFLVLSKTFIFSAAISNIFSTSSGTVEFDP